MPRRKRNAGPVWAPEPDGAISNSQLDELKEIFPFYDRDQDGKITIKELNSLMRALGFMPDESELEQMIEKWQDAMTGGSGLVSLEECEKVLIQLAEETDMVQIARDAFKIFFFDDTQGKCDVVRDWLGTKDLLGSRPLTEAELKVLFWNADNETDFDLFIVQDVLKLLIQTVQKPAPSQSASALPGAGPRSSASALPNAGPARSSTTTLPNAGARGSTTTLPNAGPRGSTTTLPAPV